MILYLVLQKVKKKEQERLKFSAIKKPSSEHISQAPSWGQIFLLFCNLLNHQDLLNLRVFLLDTYLICEVILIIGFDLQIQIDSRYFLFQNSFIL